VILTPMMTYALALALDLERFRARSVVGMALGIAGVLLVVLPETSLPEPGMVGWVLVSLIGPTSFAVSNVCAAYLRPPKTPSLAMGAAMSLFAAALLLAAMTVQGSWWFFDSGLDVGAAAVVTLGVMFALLLVFMFATVRLRGPVFFSAVNYIAPIAGVVFAMAIFGESLSPWLWAALGLMFAGLAIMNTRRRAAAGPRLAR
jgi:drug/metabolite transporter (DMT)-like permease